MAKHHKDACPLRPVLSAINTPEYALSKWIELQIKQFYDCKWSVQSREAFIADLNKLTPCDNDVCVSFDIKSLYTNVPLQEVIDDVADAMYDGTTQSIFQTNQKMSKRIFKNILKACSENIFIFNQEVYKQIDGLSMGSPLAPILANWFVAKIEKELLDGSTVKGLKFYRRYVDDIFAVFENEHDRDVFYRRLNCAHDNLQFTMEKTKATTKSLPFLDIDISIKSNCFETSVYRKPTNTNVLLNFESTAPMAWKKGVINCFLTRARRVSSSQAIFEKEVNNLRSIFRANCYPVMLMRKTIEEFGKKTLTLDQKDDNSQQPQHEVRKPEYFVLPYVGKASEKMLHRVKREMSPHGIDLRAAYRTTKTGAYFRLKQKVPMLLRSDVVYEFKCSRDENVRYIGETQRQIFKRISEHASSKTSAVYDHRRNCKNCSNDDNFVDSFCIVRGCESGSILSEEALCIKKFEPTLNVQLGIFKGARVQTVLY